MSSLSVNNKPTFQSTFQISALHSHMLSFLEDEESLDGIALQGVSRSFNLRCAEAVNHKLNKIQDILVKAGFLDKEKRIAFEEKPTAIKNVNQELERGLVEIAKRIREKFLKYIIFEKNKDKEWIVNATLNFLKEKKIPYAEKLNIELCKEPDWHIIHLPQLCDDFLRKGKPFLALYVADRIGYFSSYSKIVQQEKYCLIAAQLLHDGKVKPAIELLKRVKDIGGKLNEMLDNGSNFKYKHSQFEALCRACVYLQAKGYKKEAIENYKKCLNSHLASSVGGFLLVLIDDGADNETILSVLKSCSEEANREALRGAAVKGLLEHKKFDQLVELLEDKEFTATKYPCSSYSVDGHICYHLRGYQRKNFSNPHVVSYSPVKKDLIFKHLQGQELIDFLNKFKNLKVRRNLFLFLGLELRHLGRNQEADELRKLCDELDKQNVLFGEAKDVSQSKQSKDPAPSQSERSVQVPQASSSLKNPPQPVSQPIIEKPKLPSHAPEASSSAKKLAQSISQPKIPDEQSSSTTAKKEAKSCCLQGKDFVAAYWKQSLVFRIFSFLTFGLLPLLTFLVGGLCRRQAVKVS